MAIEPINVGTAPNDGSGDSGRNAGVKINSNFALLNDMIDALQDRIEEIQFEAGAGSVTSVQVEGNNGITATGGPITSTGTITLAIDAEVLRAHLDVEEGATANDTDANLRDRSTHTGTQAISTITDLQTELDGKQDQSAVLDATTASFTTTLKTKLDGIEEGATENETDAFLLDRANHTGTQPISTITDLETELASKIDTTDSVSLNFPTISQIREGASGWLLTSPSLHLESLAANNIGDVATSYVFNGHNGKNQVLTITDDSTITSVTNLKYDRYTVFVQAGPTGPHTLSFGSVFKLPPTMPAETSEGSGVVSIETGETYIFDIIWFLNSSAELTVVVRDPAIVGDVVLEAPTVSNVTISPIPGVDNQTFTGTQDVTGNETPTLSFEWLWNDVPVSGATSSSFTAPPGDDGEFTRVVTATNSQTPTPGANVGRASSYIGRSMPQFIGQTSIYNVDVGGGGIAPDLPLPEGTLATDLLVLTCCQQASANIGWPTDFVGASGDGQIARVSTDEGNNYRIGMASRAANGTDISNGLIPGVVLTPSGEIHLTVWRGASALVWDHTSFTRVVDDAVDMTVNTLTEPCQVLTLLAGQYPLIKAATLYEGTVAAPGSADTLWNGGDINADIPDASGRRGHILWWRKLPSGVMPEYHFDNPAGGTVYRILSTNAYILGNT